MQGEARGQGGPAERLGGQCAWVGPVPRDPSQRGDGGARPRWHRERRAYLAAGLSRVPPRGRRRLAPPGASRGSRGRPRRRSPALPLGSRVGNARRPLQAWCGWSALGRPACPSARRVGSARQGRGRAHLPGLRSASHALSLARGGPALCGSPGTRGAGRRGSRELGSRAGRRGSPGSRGADWGSSWAGAGGLQQQASQWIPGEHR